MTDQARKELEAYPKPVRWNYQQADGYLDLGMADEAHHVLDKIPEKFLGGIVYDEFLLRLAFVEEDWSAAARTCERLLALMPENPTFWIQYAYASRRSTGLEKAERILFEAQRRFPDENIIPYNLACYAVVRGDLKRALTGLKAIINQPGILQMALEDDDLEPLWSELGE